MTRDTWLTHILSGGHVAGVADFLGDHSQLLEVDQTVHLRVVAEVNERQVLLDDRKERDLRMRKQTTYELLTMTKLT